MKYIIPLVVPSLQEFFLAMEGGDNNWQTNGPNSSQDDLPVSLEVKIQNSSAKWGVYYLDFSIPKYVNYVC